MKRTFNLLYFVSGLLLYFLFIGWYAPAIITHMAENTAYGDLAVVILILVFVVAWAVRSARELSDPTEDKN